jgi:hypothetical protein
VEPLKSHVHEGFHEPLTRREGGKEERRGEGGREGLWKKPCTCEPLTRPHPICYDRLESMLQFLLEAVTLQYVYETQVEHDTVSMDTTLNITFPVIGKRRGDEQGG